MNTPKNQGNVHKTIRRGRTVSRKKTFALPKKKSEEEEEEKKIHSNFLTRKKAYEYLSAFDKEAHLRKLDRVKRLNDVASFNDLQATHRQDISRRIQDEVSHRSDAFHQNHCHNYNRAGIQYRSTSVKKPRNCHSIQADRPSKLTNIPLERIDEMYRPINALQGDRCIACLLGEPATHVHPNAFS
jgi:hypothetical protein